MRVFKSRSPEGMDWDDFWMEALPVAHSKYQSIDPTDVGVDFLGKNYPNTFPTSFILEPFPDSLPSAHFLDQNKNVEVIQEIFGEQLHQLPSDSRNFFFAKVATNPLLFYFFRYDNILPFLSFENLTYFTSIFTPESPLVYTESTLLFFRSILEGLHRLWRHNCEISLDDFLSEVFSRYKLASTDIPEIDVSLLLERLEISYENKYLRTPYQEIILSNFHSLCKRLGFQLTCISPQTSLSTNYNVSLSAEFEGIARLISEAATDSFNFVEMNDCAPDKEILLGKELRSISNPSYMIHNFIDPVSTLSFIDIYEKMQKRNENFIFIFYGLHRISAFYLYVILQEIAYIPLHKIIFFLNNSIPSSDSSSHSFLRSLLQPTFQIPVRTFQLDLGEKIIPVEPSFITVGNNTQTEFQLGDFVHSMQFDAQIPVASSASFVWLHISNLETILGHYLKKLQRWTRSVFVIASLRSRNILFDLLPAHPHLLTLFKDLEIYRRYIYDYGNVNYYLEEKRRKNLYHSQTYEGKSLPYEKIKQKEIYTENLLVYSQWSEARDTLYFLSWDPVDSALLYRLNSLAKSVVLITPPDSFLRFFQSFQ